MATASTRDIVWLPNGRKPQTIGGIANISTKERLTQIALALFSKRGYYGTSMSDIADAAGMVKASLYSHYSGKDDLFLAVAENFLQDFRRLSDRLYGASESMGVQARLHYIFTEYVRHYLKNPLMISFAAQTIRFVPDELRDRFMPGYEQLADGYRSRLIGIFAEGIKQGVIRPSQPEEKARFLLISRDGVLAWIMMARLGFEYLETFWDDYWFGVAQRTET